ncbi:MAG: phosphoglycerate kinase [Candidatus Aenigmarchaeota archaeon]|nr:phosphoglycerate kinase [Candidatus Aenigmarchaeota archaeon]
MAELLKFEDFSYRGKTVGLRVDLNLPYDPKTKTISETPRLIDHAKTIKHLSESGAKVILLAHQGRKGDEDFISLEDHANLLEKHLSQPVRFIKLDSDFSGIRELKEGEVALLDNVRSFDDETKELSSEEHAKSALPSKLAPLLDCFILDAFSVAHRAHASVVGFSTLIPSIAGPVFYKEYEFLERFLREIQFSKNDVVVLGGAKPTEPINLINRLYGKGIETVLTTGVISLLILMSRGYKLGKSEEFLKEKKYLDYLKDIAPFAKEESILYPVDVAVERNGKRAEIEIKDLPVEEPILDIGSKTIALYSKIISEANVVCMKGPAGTYERAGFEEGTKKLFEAIADSECISLIGGGNSIDCLEKLKIDPAAFTYISLSGGAFVEFLSGTELPGIAALKESCRKF